MKDEWWREKGWTCLLHRWTTSRKGEISIDDQRTSCHHLRQWFVFVLKDRLEILVNFLQEKISLRVCHTKSRERGTSDSWNWPICRTNDDGHLDGNSDDVRRRISVSSWFFFFLSSHLSIERTKEPKKTSSSNKSNHLSFVVQWSKRDWEFREISTYVLHYLRTLTWRECLTEGQQLVDEDNRLFFIT